MNSVRLGVIGCGKVVCRIHLGALRQVRGAKVVAVADPVPARRAQGARLAGEAAAFADWKELLRRANVDAVLICTPSALHAECTVAALAAGKHVYVEKPLASNLAQAESMVRAWEATGLVGMSGFNYRHHPLYRKAREIVASGTLGQIIAVRSCFTSAGDWVDEWRKERSLGGGVLLDLAGHHIDLAQFVLGQGIREVTARVASWRSEQDTAWTEMTTDDGVLVHSFFSLRGTDSNRFEIHGELARLTVDHLAGTSEIIPRDRRKLPQRVTAVLGRGWLRLKHGVTGGRDKSYELAFSKFVKAIASGCQDIAPDLHDGLRISQIIDAAEYSAATGQRWRMGTVNQLAPVG